MVNVNVNTLFDVISVILHDDVGEFQINTL